MYDKISRLLMFGDLTEDTILYQLGKAIDMVESGDYNKREATRQINAISKRLLMLATDYGFDDNLWHNYLTFYIIMNENPFSLVTEKTKSNMGLKEKHPGRVHFIISGTSTCNSKNAHLSLKSPKLIFINKESNV